MDGMSLDQGAAVDLLISSLLGAVAMIVTAHLLSGFRLRRGLLTALLAGLVYGVLHGLFQTILILISLPLVLLTFGLFILVINGLLLWLTSKLVPGLEIRSFGSLVAAAFLLAVINIAFQLTLGHSARF
jgi:putative membrane protein